MANIKGTGVPTRKTLGAMGDIYTDTTTGKQYECVFAYRDNQDDDFDCQWKELKETKDQKDSLYGEMKSEKILGGEISEKQSDKLEEIKEEVKEETKQEPAKEEAARNRTNYAAYGKKNK